MTLREILVHKSRVDIASWSIYELGVSEVLLQVSVIGIQQPRAAYLSECQYMRVV